MFTPKHIKEGKMLLKGVTKFVHYKRDVLSDEKISEIEAQQEGFKELLKSCTKEEARAQAKELQKVCERSVPMPSLPGIRENVEVFFVAIVIALGIRSYFLQPFKIPTGSMQPTLNGIIAESYPDTPEANEEWNNLEPNIVFKGWDLLWHGRNYVELRAEEDFIVTGAKQSNWMKFFSFTHIQRKSLDGAPMKPLKVWAPLNKAMDLGLRDSLAISSPRNFANITSGPAPELAKTTNMRQPKVSKGQLLMRGYVDTGDQVLVNKMSYHFRKPDRGEVFVFTTNKIDAILARTAGRQTQHYIKRLSGVPGDTFRIGEVSSPEEAYQLHINGEKSKEPGNIRVMERNPPYEDTGYRLYNRAGESNWNEGTIGDKEYLALGDNSPASWDSRGWGPVPEANLVGSALFVYWPFAKHWGLID